MAYMVKSSCWRCIWINFEFKRKESVWRQCSNKVGQSLTCAQPDWQWAWGQRRKTQLHEELLLLHWKWRQSPRNAPFDVQPRWRECSCTSCKLCPRVSWSKKSQWAAIGSWLHARCIFTRPNPIPGPSSLFCTRPDFQAPHSSVVYKNRSGCSREGSQISQRDFQPPAPDSCAETKPSGQNFPHLSFSAITTPEQNKPELSSFEMQYSFNF